ncbi:MAG: nucleotide-binding protein, partial [Methanobacteriota archaeon]
TSRLRFERLRGQGLEVRDPTTGSRAAIQAAAGASGDAGVLSEADIDLLALARDLAAVIVTDDFAIQNVALRIGISTQQIQQRSARRVRWRFRCTGCGRYYLTSGECPICGAPMKRTMK